MTSIYEYENCDCFCLHITLIQTQTQTIKLKANRLTEIRREFQTCRNDFLFSSAPTISKFNPFELCCVIVWTH